MNKVIIVTVITVVIFLVGSFFLASKPSSLINPSAQVKSIAEPKQIQLSSPTSEPAPDYSTANLKLELNKLTPPEYTQEFKALKDSLSN